MSNEVRKRIFFILKSIYIFYANGCTICTPSQTWVIVQVPSRYMVLPGSTYNHSTSIYYTTKTDKQKQKNETNSQKHTIYYKTKTTKTNSQ